MNTSNARPLETDIVIVGAGPVGLLCAYLGHLCGLRAVVVDKSEGPLKVGRADALNARTLQLLEVAKLFDSLYPLGKPCNTSSVWAEGKFLSRQSTWWEELEGCLHKHFLMLGQPHVERLLDQKLTQAGLAVRRRTGVEDIEIMSHGCVTTLSNGEKIASRYVIGADGSRSFVRTHFNVPFEITRPQIVWAVIDGLIDTDFAKVPEIIVFQAESSDVAWIPREGDIDRFYVRMDTKEFQLEEALAKINRAMQPHALKFKRIDWFSRFSVKESVAERFSIEERVFLAGDACHIHSVNGGQGLNTGLGDAFNLMWKLNMVVNHHASADLLKTYENERKPVALSVVATSGELVRSTKYSRTGTHAQDYVKIVEKRSGNVTGMGIRYGEDGLKGQRLFDFEVVSNGVPTRLYSLMEYSRYTLLVFGKLDKHPHLPSHLRLIEVSETEAGGAVWTTSRYYRGQALLVRPDCYIEAAVPLERVTQLVNKEKAKAYFGAVNAYDEATIKEMVREDYIQHNPKVPTGRRAFLELLPTLREHRTQIENLAIIADGPYVAMHHRWKKAAPLGADALVAFHVIRFDDEGLIAEHWSAMAETWAPPEVERELSYQKKHRVFKEGNFTLTVSQGTRLGQPSAIYDLVRSNESKADKRWRVVQVIPTSGVANDNTMFNFDAF